MLFALMTLVALSLAAVALVRSVDTGALIIGNMGFKADTVMAGDEATRQALNFLESNQGGGLDKDNAEAGYYVGQLASLDITGSGKDPKRKLIDWKLDGCAGYDPEPAAADCVKPVAQKIDLPNGLWARYIVMKMCTGKDADVDCLGPTNQRSSQTLESGELKYTESEYAKGKSSAVYYRIIVRTEGAREAVTYTESIAHNYEGEEPPTPTP